MKRTHGIYLLGSALNANLDPTVRQITVVCVQPGFETLAEAEDELRESFKGKQPACTKDSIYTILPEYQNDKK